MRVLMITGDKNITPLHPRFVLQAKAVEFLVPIYWGRGAIFPSIPTEHFDVVTVQDPFWRGLFAFHIARRLGSRFNVQVHTDLSSLTFLRYLLAKFVLRRANSVRVVSKRIEAQVRGFGVKTPVTILPIHIDSKRFQNILRKPHNQKTILWIGRFEKEKEPARAIEILRQLLDLGLKAKLIMLGEGSLGMNLKTLGKDLPIEFPGWQDPRPYLEVSDVVLSTSKSESWGASIIEALATGVPVVAPDVGVAREAGALIAEDDKLAGKTAEVLEKNPKGELKINLLNEEEWSKKWRESL